MQTMRTQLAVIGGGPAGVCAAITAARRADRVGDRQAGAGRELEQ